MNFDFDNEGYAEGEEPLHFFYNREERLKNAPQIVKDYYDGKMKPPGIKILFTNKNYRFMLISLLIVTAFSWIYSGFSSTQNQTKINDAIFELSAFEFEEEIYVSIKVSKNSAKKSQNQNEIPRNFTIEILAFDSDNAISKKEIHDLVFDGNESFLRTKFTDYGIIYVNAKITENEETKEITCDVLRQ